MSLEEDLAEKTKEYEDRSALYDRLNGEVMCADAELYALGNRALVLVRVQEMLDARNGMNGREDAVVLKIRRRGRYYDREDEVYDREDEVLEEISDC